ncbi:uncharacterized protein LOC143922167 [Arctopsyche grandis]|uniref:uncharacterized protein LOC143922167 n=1 Tax=Arctopsyche grandis TaxID=121162 RepID=UPI00406D98D8
MFRGLDQRNQKFYQQVADMVTRINSNKSTIKNEVYKTPTPERYHALLHKVLLNFQVLKKIVKKTEFMKNLSLGVVIAYEVLTKKIRNDGFRRKLKQAMGTDELKEPITKSFVRINTLKGTFADLDGFITKATCIPNVYEIFDHEVNKGNEPNNIDQEIESNDIESYESQEDTSSEDEANKAVSQEKEKEKEGEIVASHKKIKDLHLLKLVPGKIKVQNFSSCLPAFILNPEKDSVVLDATAAPGNKTTHLCSIMENTGKIYAFERNSERYTNLVANLESYGATNVQPIHSDFLKITPETYKPDYILLDPSCSGSGIHVNYKKVQKRIDTLQNFQAMMLNHALKFGAKKVVYSVCSVHPEEGEAVVKEALEKNPDYELENIPNYTEARGVEGYEFKDLVVRTNNEDDGTIGFFVALFTKKQPTEQ